MPLKSWKKNIGFNIRELKADNQKSGSEKGANGKPRAMAQIIAIALSKAMPMKKMHEKKHEESEYATIRKRK